MPLSLTTKFWTSNFWLPLASCTFQIRYSALKLEVDSGFCRCLPQCYCSYFLKAHRVQKMSDLNDQLSDAMFCQCWKTSRAENISVRSKSCFDPCVCCTASFITVNDAKSFTQPFIQVTPVKTFHKSRHLAYKLQQRTSSLRTA